MSVAYEQPKNSTDYRFSQSEIKLLNLLPQDGTKINTLELTKKFYSDRRVLPEYARIAIGGLIRALVDKTYDFKRGFRVMRSERQGPKPILVWMEVLPSRAKAKSVQAKSVQAKSVQAKLFRPSLRPSLFRPSQRRPSQRRPSQFRPSQRRPSQRRPSLRRPSQRRPSQRRPSSRPSLWTGANPRSLTSPRPGRRPGEWPGELVPTGLPGHDLLLSSLLPQDKAMGSPSSGPGASEG
jgi:hypothetical protein